MTFADKKNKKLYRCLARSEVYPIGGTQLTSVRDREPQTSSASGTPENRDLEFTDLVFSTFFRNNLAALHQQLAENIFFNSRYLSL